eukprot:c24894_g5_i2 orf=276-2210(+)
MGTQDYKAYARRRKVKREEHGEGARRFQGRWAQGGSLKKEYIKGCTLEDEPTSRLLNLELDVAEALADFWRMAHQPSEQGKFNTCLRWSHKRKRTSLLNKDTIAPSKPKEEPEDALSTAKKNRSSCTFGRDLSTSDRDEIESTQMSKESFQFESRAQSPSSPLPSLQLPCATFLACGNPAAKSAFQKVLPLVPLERPCLLPVKTEIEDICLDGFPGRPQKVPVRQKSKSGKSTVSKATVKTEPLGEQVIDTRDLKGTASPQESGVKSLALEVHQVAGLLLSNKPGLSEKEKEARRLRRIQANRESARQTIRKKQVLCEELTKKASTLALENECMKQKRESLMQELFSLKGQNFHLKQQLEMRSSGNSGFESVELPQRMSSDSLSVPALQAPSLPYAGAPVHSFVWAMAAAQAAVANQTYAFTNKESLDANHANLASQHQTSALVSPVTPSSKQALVSGVTEPKSSHAYNDECSPASMGLSHKETGSSTGVCAESCTRVSAGGPYYPYTVALGGASLDLPGKSACEISVQARCSLPQPTAAIPCTTKSIMPGIAVASESMDCYMGAQISQGVSCGYTYNSSRGGYFLKGNSPPNSFFLKGNSPPNSFMGRNYFAAMVAAEARRKRKELTRSKFSRSRGVRPATIS